MANYPYFCKYVLSSFKLYVVLESVCLGLSPFNFIRTEYDLASYLAKEQNVECCFLFICCFDLKVEKHIIVLARD